MARYLTEVLEEDATGTLADTYTDIRSVLGVPVVNLIYRHLAAEPGRLESTWAALRPNLAHPTTQALAARLARSADRSRPRVKPIDPEESALAPISPADGARARATLAVYERANTLNLLAIFALLDGTPGSAAGGPSPSSIGAARDADILPMADLDSLAADPRAALAAMSAALATPGEETLVPSLFRHLASSPPLLELVSSKAIDALAAKQTRRAGELVAERARALAARLPHRVEPAGNDYVRRVLERFAPTIATMLVVGGIVNELLSGLDDRSRR
jgi:hypothetical protein